MGKKGEIQDFGEKIAGAKKELAALKRMLRSEDIVNWSDEDRKNFITKSQLWKPDYQQMKADGMDIKAIYFIKQVYDSLPTRPTAPTKEAQERYLDFMNYFKDNLDNIKTTKDATEFFKSKVVNSPFINPIKTGMYTSYNIVGEYHGLMTNKTFRAAQYSEREVRKKIDKHKFLMSKEEQYLKDYDFFEYKQIGTDNTGKPTYNANLVKGDCTAFAVRFEYGNGSYRNAYLITDERFKPQNWQENTVVALKRGEIVEVGFSSLEEAKEFIIEKEKMKEAETKKAPSKKKTNFQPQYLDHIQRIGFDYRNGENVTGEDIQKAFNIRGGQFGNWETQEDRQANLNLSFEAFKDMAKALEIEDTDISLGGKLNIAFGARGSGDALAHFEPRENVINITKMRGAGSLGHEWGHALDYYLARRLDLKTTFSTQEDTLYGRASVPDVIKPVLEAIKRDENGNMTEFYKDAMLLDKHFTTKGNQSSAEQKGYWASNVELFARAFATYAMDKLSPNKNDYLCGHAQSVTLSPVEPDKPIYTYPRGEERQAINAAFDKMFDTLKERHILHQRTQDSEQKLIRQIDGETREESPTSKPKTNKAEKPKVEADFNPYVEGNFEQMDFTQWEQIMGKIAEETKAVTEPELFGVKKGIVCQQVNCRGAYGAGLSGAISEIFPEVEEAYYQICKEYEKTERTDSLLGKYQMIDCTGNGDLLVANIFSQENYGNSSRTGIVYTDTDKLISSIQKIAENNPHIEVYIPHHVDDKGNHTGIGCGLAGEKWENIQSKLEALNLPNLTLLDTINESTEKVAYFKPEHGLKLNKGDDQISFEI